MHQEYDEELTIATECPSKTGNPSWDQVTLGEGTPSTKQVRTHEPPAMHSFEVGASRMQGYTTKSKTKLHKGPYHTECNRYPAKNARN